MRLILLLVFHFAPRVFLPGILRFFSLHKTQHSSKFQFDPKGTETFKRPLASSCVPCGNKVCIHILLHLIYQLCFTCCLVLLIFFFFRLRCCCCFRFAWLCLKMNPKFSPSFLMQLTMTMKTGFRKIVYCDHPGPTCTVSSRIFSPSLEICQLKESSTSTR